MTSSVHRVPDAGSDWPSAPGWLPLDAASAQRIADVDDPAVRNLWITQAYADLGRRLVNHIGPDQTWCTFGVWASNTAGVSIRSAELPHIVERLLAGASTHVDAAVDRAHRVPRPLAPFDLLGRFGRDHIARLVDTALGQVSERIAHGNTLVYRELTPLFIAFVEHLEARPVGSTDDVDAVLASIGIPDADDRPLVHAAFRSYCLAVATDDDRMRAQFVLAGNVAAVLHEQQRLQDDIAAALDAGLLDVGDELAAASRWFVPPPLRRLLVDGAVERITPHLERLWEHIATHLLMTLAVPDGLLHLGADVPPPVGASLFPDVLEPVDHPDARRLMDDWDPTGGTGNGSAANDWSVLHQRMGYIVNLFRSRQRHAVLSAAPFNRRQVDSMMEQRLPADL